MIRIIDYIKSRFRRYQEGRFKSKDDRRYYHDLLNEEKILLQSIGIFVFTHREPGSLFVILALLKRIKVLEDKVSGK